MAETTLPKDVGLCASCNARNSKHGSRCHACGATLPWVKVKATKVAPSAPTPAAAPRQSAATTSPSPHHKPLPPPAKPSLQGFNPASGVDWGASITFVLLTFVVFAASLIIPILGFFLYRHFAEEESPLRFAAGAGLGIVVCLIGLRFASRLPD